MRHPRVRVALFTLLLGSGALVNLFGNPRIKALHGSDVVQMIAAGLCLGVALALLIQSARRSPPAA